VLDSTTTEVLAERNARKSPLSEDEARQLIAAVDRVLVAKGRKIVELASAEATPDHLKGPTGNYRAPIVRRGDTLLVGFHQQALEDLL